MKGRVADILRPNSISCTVTPNINYLVFMNTIIKMEISTRYSQQYTMVAWVVVVIVDGLGPISTSPISTNIFSNVVRVRWLVSLDLDTRLPLSTLYHPPSHHHHGLYLSSHNHHHNLYHPSHNHDHYITSLLCMDIFF